MGATRRVWVIEDDAAGDLRSRGDYVSGYDRGPFVVRDRTRLLFCLCLLLGPLAIACTRRGAARILWAGIVIANAAVWSGTCWRWDALRRWLERGSIPFVPWAAGMLLTSLLGILAWALTLHGIGTDRRFDPEKLPRWLRSPLPATILGVVAPGMSLLVNGAAKRAAFAAWHAGITVLAALVLWQLRWLWRANGTTVSWPLVPNTLEWALLAVAAAGFLAAFSWLAAVLDGVRCGSDGNHAALSFRADVLMLVLLAALTVAYAASEPEALAWDANETATTLEKDGMRRVPLLLVQLARRLDPARPAYAVHVASLMETCGDVAGARGVHAELQARWQEYQRVFAAQVEGDSTSAAPVGRDSTAAASVHSDSSSTTAAPVDSLSTTRTSRPAASGDPLPSGAGDS